MPLNLLTTKLFVPPARANLVPRLRLFDRLQHGLQGKLTLIAAPAGFGKTTLLSAWYTSVGSTALSLAWVSLDAADNDPLLFWSYVLAALDTIAPGIGTPALALLQSPQPPPIDTILTSVLNAFTGPALGMAPATGPEGRDIALVLEDYHVITAPAIHQSLGRLLEYVPPHLHLVIATRADPPLPLARLRASGAVTELHADDLRFTPDEVAILLNQVMGLALTADDLAALEARTEGWIAGLQLVALALHDHRDPAGFIRSFRGSNRYIVDYLATEVFARQPAPIQAFLLHTSILDRMCGPLCDAILHLPPGPEGRATTIEQPIASVLDPGSSADTASQRVLEELERANLFVVPLDEDRHWYRYHHLFADALRQRLTYSTTGAAVATLHERASVWYEQQDLIAEAVQHAVAARDEGRVARLIEQHGVRIIVGGQVHTVLTWLSTLPDVVVRSHPLLCTVHALALLLTNQLEATAVRIQDAERYIQSDTPTDDAQIIQGRAAVLRAILVRYMGDFASCVAFAQQALRVLPETETVARTVAMLNAARAFLVSGDVTDANERLAMAVVAPIRASGNLFGALAAFTNLAQMQILQGRLRAAAVTLHEAMHIAPDPEVFRSLEGSPAYYFGMGELLCEWNDLDAAEHHVAQGMDLVAGPLTVDAAYITQGQLALARLQHARGEHVTAKRTLARLRDVAHQRGFVASLITRVAGAHAQLALTTGDLPAAVAWADTSGMHAEDTLSFPREAEYLILARVWIAQAEHHAADSVLPQVFTLLDRLLEDAAAKGRQSSVLEILIVRALACWAQGTHGEALATLERALVLAEPEGYIRRFVDEGPAMEAILRAASARGSVPHYIAKLLSSFAGSRDETAGMGADDLDIRSYSPAPIPPFYEGGRERLSVREVEVLRLIASGKTNAEIAQALVVAVSTIKSHINSIFGKLQVRNRREAILRAREMHLL